jgi:p-cumate 2,3-dioxygenase subunit alpha
VICRKDNGNAEQFQCFYHAWTFNNKGQLVGVPDRSGYAAQFDPAQHGLQSPPRLESYRGLYFASLDPDVESLESYFGEAREFIDQTMDAAEPLGGWTVIAGSSRFTVRGNWKLMIENSTENYHFAPVHQTYTEYMTNRRAEAGVQGESREEMRSRARAHGLSGRHSIFMLPAPGRTLAYPTRLWTNEAYEEVERLRGVLLERYGEARGREIAEMARLMGIFPNLIFQDTQSGFRLRLVLPVSADCMNIIQWDLAPRDERADLRAYRMELSLAFLGPGGFGTADDIEAIESSQTGFQIPEVEWSDLSRGMHRAPREDDEIGPRTFWREWHAMMQGRTHAPAVEEHPGARPTLTTAR